MTFSSDVTLSDPSNVGGSADATLTYDLQQALSLWSSYISGIGTLVVSLNIVNTPQGRADGAPTSSSLLDVVNGVDVYEPSSLYELTTGSHVAGSTSDITINVSPAYFSNLDLASGLTYNSAVPDNEYNPIIIFMHELMHGFGMAGYYSQSGVRPSGTESLFDSYIKILSDGDAVFTGSNAEAAYGSAIALTTDSTAGENYYHFGNQQSDLNATPSTVKDPLTLDLMNGIVFYYNYQYKISPLDLGVLRDLGYTVACFASGTRIATLHGECGVEALAPGDLVLTGAGVARPVVWVGHRHVDCAHHPTPPDVWPVRIRAGAFGDRMPSRDLLLSPDHAVLVDGVLIPVRYLLNGATIVQQMAGTVTYWHVELERHGVLLAEGLPCESYLDTGNRSAFGNGGRVVQLHPAFAPRAGNRRAGLPPPRPQQHLRRSA